MSEIFHDNTIDEWLYEYFDPTAEQLEEMYEDIMRIKNKRVYPVRGFNIQRRHTEL